ncbi:ParB N-terminal domain-containing protein [Microbacterium oxydans]|nr:ParB N-terminal domain-containing protein [Microbacterium oxydans]
MTTTTTPGTIEHIDPQTIDVATNVRTEATLGKEFVDSIRANGVLQPVVAYRDSEGVHVRYGQRRTLAAQMVGLATMPVYVVDVDDTDTAQRIIEQLVENDQREALGEGDRLDAWRQLELEGLSATQIAKRTGTKRDTIKTGLTVASSDTGTRLVAEVGLTLDQAATLIEFEDDPQAVADLTEIAGSQPDYFPVAVQRARNERAAAVLREKVETEVATKGHHILSSSPSWEEATPYRLHQVTDEGGNRITSDYVEGKPGIAAHVRAWDAEQFEVTYYVDDLDAAGLILRPGATSGAAKGPMTDEQKAERKTLIANNKEWDAAEAVRREWVATFLARKTLPKDAMSVVATILATGGYDLGQSIGHGNSQAQEFLGIERGYGDKLAEYLTAHPTRAAHVAVAIVLGGIEQQTSRDTWRSPERDGDLPPDAPDMGIPAVPRREDRRDALRRELIEAISP